MSKRRIGKLYNKIVVEGDYNLLNKNEVLLTQTNNIVGGVQLELKGNNTVSLSSSKYYLCKGDPLDSYANGSVDFITVVHPQVPKDIKCWVFSGLYVSLEYILSDPENYYIAGLNIDYDKIIDIDMSSTPHKCITISDAIKSNPEGYERFKKFIDNFTEVSREQYMDALNNKKWKYK